MHYEFNLPVLVLACLEREMQQLRRRGQEWDQGFRAI
jgi:hypothetical protein